MARMAVDKDDNEMILLIRINGEDKDDVVDEVSLD